MYPGGIPNLVPALAVLLGIGTPSVQAGTARLERAPGTILDTLGGMVDTGFAFLEHPTLDSRSEEHTSELQSLMRISYAVFCLKKKKTTQHNKPAHTIQ